MAGLIRRTALTGFNTLSRRGVHASAVTCIKKGKILCAG